MKNLFIFGKAMVIALIIMATVSCNLFDKEDEETNDLVSSTITATTDTPIYFNFGSGKAVSSTEEWDVTFNYNRMIYTRSGDSFKDGKGRVYYTGTTDFSSVTTIDNTKFSGDYSSDKTIYRDMHGAVPININIMTWVEYGTGSGTEADPFSSVNGFRDSYYSYTGMPPVYSFSKNIYVIKGANGSTSYKFQVLAAGKDTTKGELIFKFQYQKL